MARALDLHSRGHRFDSDILHDRRVYLERTRRHTFIKRHFGTQGTKAGRRRKDEGSTPWLFTDPITRVKFIDMLEEKQQSYKRNAEG